MPDSKQPKVLLFDIGGVCVVSPFQAILDYEIEQSIPPGWINHSISHLSPNGAWHRLERGELPISTSFFSQFSKDLHNSSLWPAFYTSSLQKDPSLPTTVPPLPNINAETVFWAMISKSRDFDPWMYPALLKLRESGKYILGALSNTIPFPAEHTYANPEPEKDIRRVFDVFVSSAHVGLRKPDPKIYELAIKMLNEYAKGPLGGQRKSLGGGGEIKAEDIVFLDDIGENLKAAKKVGFQTIKVNLGRTFEAVDTLEGITGLELAGNHPRVPVLPVVGKGKSKEVMRAKL